MSKRKNPQTWPVTKVDSSIYSGNTRITRTLQYSCANLLVQRLRWELKLSYGDGIHAAEGDPRHVLALQADEVVLADQEGLIRDKNKTLLLVVPVIDPGKRTALSSSRSDAG